MTLRPKIAEHIVEIIEALQKAGFEAYIVGGAVRDFLLDRQPKDYDLSTSATPEQIRRVFHKRRALIIGRRFKLVHLYHGKDIVEISTFRKCPNHEIQSNRPVRAANAPENMIFHDNEFGTSEEDAQRRDFTVNAIFYDPVNDEIIDYTSHGLDDICNKVVRIIGNPVLRFEEDPVRLLRALKLVGQYGFTLEKNTEAALKSCMPLICHASPSRLTLELDKILKNPYGDKILRCFRDYDFLQYILPFLDRNFDTPQTQYALSLLAKRNERLLAGKYRDSLSLVNALLTLPFIEKKIGDNPPGGLWTAYPGIDVDMKTLMLKVFDPHMLTKRGSAAAIRTLIFQPRLKPAKSNHRDVGKHGYSGARELAIIQNEVMWHIPDFEEACPLPDPTKTSSRSRRRRHRSRKHSDLEAMDPKSHNADEE